MVSGESEKREEIEGKKGERKEQNKGRGGEYKGKLWNKKGEKEREGGGYSGMGGRHWWVLRHAGQILIILGKVKLCWHNMGPVRT